MKKTPEYTGGLRDNYIKQEWDNIKHQFGLSVSPVVFNATEKTIVDPEVKGYEENSRYASKTTFYHYILDDVYKNIDEIVKRLG